MQTAEFKQEPAAPASRHHRFRITSFIVVGTAATALAAWLAHSPRSTAGQSQGKSPDPAALAAPSNPEPVISARATPEPDPRFVRVQTPTLPAVTIPEARQMVDDMMKAFRCFHTANRRTPASALPPSAGDAADNIDTLAARWDETLATLPDACYVNTVLPQLANPRTPGALANILYSDLAKRPDIIRLRAYFIVASIEGHPLSENALGNLRTLVNANYERDWARWEQAVSQHVAHDLRGARVTTCRTR